MPDKVTRIGISYLSLTGNTKVIAERIGAEVAAPDTTVSYYDLMAKTHRKDFPLSIDPAFLQGNDILGFGCFTAAYQPMYFYRKLLDRIGSLRGKSYFVFCTYGVKFGSTLTAMKRAIDKSKAAFLGGDAFASSDEVKDFALNRFYLRHDQPGEAEFTQARGFAARIMSNYRAISSGRDLRPSQVTFPHGEPLFRFLGASVCRQGLVRYLRRFAIDGAKCIRCGWCVDICPSQSLSLTADSAAPVLDANCQGCGMCVECRQGAIAPEKPETGVKSSARWERLFYGQAPRKTLDDRELELLKRDRFLVMKSRPELMSSRG